MRKFLLSLITVALALTLAGCRSADTVTGGAGDDVFKIGFFGALSGDFASSGKDTLNGLKMYLEEIDSSAGGVDIELVTEDTGGDPQNALVKVRKLVEQDAVDVLVGPTIASEGYAVQDYIDQSGVPTLFPTVSGDDITQRLRSDWILRTGWSSSQPVHPFAQWVYDEGVRRVAIIAYDYAFGWENVGGFQNVFEDLGGEVVQKLWTPQETSDFAPYLGQLNRDVDGVVVAQSGANALRFLQQWQSFGLKGEIPLYGLAAITDESLLRTMGDEAEGLVTALHWSAALDTPEAESFVSAFEEKYDYPPGYRAEAGYVSGGVIDQALDDAGESAEAEGLMDAMRAVQIDDAPRGPISFDEYGGVVQNIYIRRVEEVDGELQNTVVDRYDDVSQFWKYDPEEFLDQPVYSRNDYGQDVGF